MLKNSLKQKLSQKMSINVDKMCRTCMSEDTEMVSLDENEIQRKLSECCNLQISLTDDLPKKICVSCINEIERVCSFREKCLQTDIHLRKLIYEQEPEKIDVTTIKIEPEIDFSDAFDDISANEPSNVSFDNDDACDEEPLYECEMCLKKFRSKKKLKTHVNTNQCMNVQEPDEFTCHICKKTFERKDRLSRHLKEHFTPEIPDGEIDLKEIRKTMKSAKPNEMGMFECKVCGLMLRSRKTLTRHHKVHMGIKFKCKFCEKSYNRKYRVTEHMRDVHGVEISEEPEIIKDITQTTEDNLKNISKSAEPNALGLFECETCGIMLKTRRILIRHCQTHLGIKFKCTLCDKSYNRKYRVTEHMKNEHGTESTEDLQIIPGESFKKCEEFSCEKCGKSFRNKYKLRDHLNVVHSDARPFLCNQCGQSFKTKAILQYHETRYHIKIKPFKCGQCPKAYYTNKELVAHIRSHTGEKPFVCPDCGSSYSHSDSLNTHRRVHTGDRPYKCEFCPKAFTKGERLKIHRRTHTGERPYACSICNQRFTQKYDMIKHEKRHPEYENPIEIISNDVVKAIG